MNYPNLEKIGDVRLVSEQAYMQANTYRILGPDGCILVDPGGGVQTDEILSALKQEGIELKDISAVLLTHYHCDHALCAYWFKNQGIPIMSSAHTAEIMERADSSIWFEHPEMIHSCKIDSVLADGEDFTIAGLNMKAVATPGHTLGCMSFLFQAKGERIAVVGDVLMPDGQPGWAGDEYSSELLLNSLATLSEWAPDRVYGGHSIELENIQEWLKHGIELGRAGKWTPLTGYMSSDIPEALL